MYMYTCVYIYIYIYMYVHTHIYVYTYHTSICTYIFICTDVLTNRNSSCFGAWTLVGYEGIGNGVSAILWPPGLVLQIRSHSLGSK